MGGRNKEVLFGLLRPNVFCFCAILHMHVGDYGEVVTPFSFTCVFIGLFCVFIKEALCFGDKGYVEFGATTLRI